MTSNEEVNEIYESHLREVESEGTLRDVQKSMTQEQLVMLVLFGVAIYYIAWIKQAMDTKTAWLITIVVGVVVYLNYMKQEKDTGPLSDKQAKAILIKELEWKQYNTREIPQGEIRVGPYCKLRFMEGKAWKWDIYFEIIKMRGGKNMYSAELHPFSGRIVAIKARPEGFTGKEAGDVKFIRTREDVWQDKYGRKKTGMPAVNTGGSQE